jgi:hypothetical protein
MLDESTASGKEEGGDLGGSGCWKPVRLVAAHTLFELLKKRYQKPQLRLVLERLVNALITAAKKEQEGDKGACNGLPMRVSVLLSRVATV